MGCNTSKESVQPVEGQEEKNDEKLNAEEIKGGPCGGKTTGQSRLCAFFEHMGWRVFRIPESASVMLSAGIKFSDMGEDESVKFQENLLKTMMQIENTVFELARSCQGKCLIICDRGVMDASAFVTEEHWQRMMRNNGWNEVQLRDDRYDQVVHMVSAANGAEDYYTIENNAHRSEKIEMAKVLDDRIAAAWVGHPSYDVIDNSADFEDKIRRMIAAVCEKIGLDVVDMLQKNSRKYKFLVRGSMPEEPFFHEHKDFEVINTYLHAKPGDRVVLTRRGFKTYFSYTYTVRRTLEHTGHVVEIMSQTSKKDYANLMSQKDIRHCAVHKKRRCFLENKQYFMLDQYREPSKGMLILEAYSALDKNTLMKRLPAFLDIEKDVTDDPEYSMHNLSMRC